MVDGNATVIPQVLYRDAIVVICQLPYRAFPVRDFLKLRRLAQQLHVTVEALKISATVSLRKLRAKAGLASG